MATPKTTRRSTPERREGAIGFFNLLEDLGKLLLHRRALETKHDRSV